MPLRWMLSVAWKTIKEDWKVLKEEMLYEMPSPSRTTVAHDGTLRPRPPDNDGHRASGPHRTLHTVPPSASHDT
jgi:hypothetical protein